MLGAQKAVGIDIDTEALNHAKKNARANRLNAKFFKTVPTILPSQNIFLMNMLWPEQKEFHPSRFNSIATIWIVSGILKSQKKEYLKQAKRWGWKVLAEKAKGEWMGWFLKVQ